MCCSVRCPQAGKARHIATREAVRWGQRTLQQPPARARTRSPDYKSPIRVHWYSLVFSLDEKFLAGKTGGLFLFVVGFYRGGTDELDRRPQLHRSK